MQTVALAAVSQRQALLLDPTTGRRERRSLAYGLTLSV